MEISIKKDEIDYENNLIHKLRIIAIGKKLNNLLSSPLPDQIYPRSMP